MELPLESIPKLKLIKKCNTWAIKVHVTRLLHRLHWLPVYFQVQLKMLVVTNKDLYGMGPWYMQTPLPRYLYQSHQIWQEMHVPGPIQYGLPPERYLRRKPFLSQIISTGNQIGLDLLGLL